MPGVQPPEGGWLKEPDLSEKMFYANWKREGQEKEKITRDRTRDRRRRGQEVVGWSTAERVIWDRMQGKQCENLEPNQASFGFCSDKGWGELERIPAGPSPAPPAPPASLGGLSWFVCGRIQGAGTNLLGACYWGVVSSGLPEVPSELCLEADIF